MPDITDVYLGDLPLTTSIGSNDTIVGVLSGRAQRIRFSDFQPDTEIEWSDVNNKPFYTIDTDLLKIGETVGGDTMLTFSDAFNTHISSIDSHTSLSNSDYSNSNLNSLINSLAGYGGYRVKSTTESGGTNPMLAYNGSAYTNANLGAWEFALMSNVAGSQPTSSGTGEGTQWSWSYNSAQAMASNYVLDLKRYNFDNTWTASRSYQVGAVVVYDSKMYQCITANSDSSFTPAKWTLLSGGGGVGDTPQEQWRNLFTAMLNGLTRALDIHYGWQMEGSWEYSPPGQWDTYSAQYGYAYDASSVPYWGYHNYTDETLLRDETLKFRGKILEVLKGMAEAYISLGTAIRSNTTANNKFDDTVYSRYVFNKMSSSLYNEYNSYTDVMYGLFKAMAPKIVKGEFLANDWTTTQIGTDEHDDPIYTYKCTLSHVVNPSNINPFAYDAYTEKPSGFPTFPDGLGYTYQPLDMIMDLDESISAANNEAYTASIDYFTRISELREAYSKIFLTNIADVSDSKDDYSMPNSWQDVTVYTAVGVEPPSVNIPVKFLVFPFPYNLADFQ